MVFYTITFIKSCKLAIKTEGRNVVCPSLFFQFTFDKDGKVIDATLPVISGLERKVHSSGKPFTVDPRDA